MRSDQVPFALALVVAVLTAGCSSLVGEITDRASNDWALEATGVQALHDRGLTGEGVRVAVVDTGVHASHAEFGGVTISWADVVNGRARPYDDGGHGTHVSGLLVAQATAGVSGPEVLGVAPGASLIHIKAVPGGGRSGDGNDVAAGIRAAVRAGAHVIVLSLGGGQPLPIIGTAVEDAANDAIDRGVVVVAAAGNAADGERGEDCSVASPASVPRVIAVGAIDRDLRIAEFSCAGDNAGGPLGLLGPEEPNRKPELVAPGVELVGPWPPERECGPRASDYCVLSGTSQAAPIVGGVVALLLELNPQLKGRDAETVGRVKQALVDSAQSLGGAGHDDRYGYGLVRGDLAAERLR